MSLHDLKQLPGHLIRRVQQISSAIFAEEMAAFDVTSVQFIALVAIGESDDLDATRLAAMIDFDRATIGGVIERLERKGLIARHISATDRRIKVLRLTPAGQALITASYGHVIRVQKRLLEGLTASQTQALMGGLNMIVTKHSTSKTDLSESD